MAARVVYGAPRTRESALAPAVQRKFDKPATSDLSSCTPSAGWPMSLRTTRTGLRTEDTRLMRICLVSPYDLSLEGGVNKHIFYLAESLRAVGDEVEVIGPKSGTPPDAREVTCFGGVVSIQGNESDNRLGIFTSPLAVRRYMRSRSFDVIHVHEPFVPSLAYYATWMCDARARVATFHRYSENEGSVTRIARQALSPHLWSYQRGIAVSDAAARYAQVAWNRPLSIIPNGVDTTFFTPLSPPRQGGGPLRLLFVGQWTDKRKGLPVLLEAYGQLRARHVDVTLDVVGQGDPSVPGPVGLHGLTFHGRVSESELRRRFRECDIFVAPSTGQESFGIVLVEAMASGRPVVCSDIEGYRQVVTQTGSVL
ncbi:MAG: glycosyltransferase family 1 protein, partial [Myxococcales bacterium]|nr:glycosyltransferase family 1 protein [Myxococcales bacterium]